MQPLVSVIFSTFNNESTIGASLASLRNQTYSHVEIIVVDEWSKDRTAEIASQYGARVYHFGPERSNCRNLGIKNAQGEYVVILDSDMELEPNVLEECVNLAQKGERAIAITEISQGQGFWSRVRALERSFYAGDDILEAARFFERKFILGIGGYDPEIVGAEDWDLHQRIMKLGIKPPRTLNHIIHHEGRLTFWRLVRKKAYYGAAFNEFRRRYPAVFNRAVFRTPLLKNWSSLVRHPLNAVGIFSLKFCEGLSLLWGMHLAARGKRANHY